MSSRNERERKRRIELLVKFLLGLLCALIALVVGAVVLFIVATIPQRQAQAQATRVAEQHANLVSVDNFYTFSRAETYYTVTGQDNENRNIIVIVPARGDSLTVLNAADGNNAGQVRTIVRQAHPDLTITRVNLGMFRDRPTWEVVARNSDGVFQFFLVDWANGQFVSNTQAEEGS